MNSLGKIVEEGLGKLGDEFGMVRKTMFNEEECIVSEIMREVEKIDEKPDITKDEFDKANALEELCVAALEGIKPQSPETKEEFKEAMNEILKS